jgi:hypothetical protein
MPQRASDFEGFSGKKKWLLERQDGVVWTGLIWLRIETSGGSCEHSNEHLGSIKCWEILE